MRHAVVASPFYEDLYSDVDLDAVDSVSSLDKLPIVDKEMLRKHMDQVYAIPRRGAVVGHTGGTTGKSLEILMTPVDMMKRMAMLDHFKHRVGFEHREMTRATFNGKHIVPPNRATNTFWRYNHSCRQMIYSSFHITDDNLGNYVRSLNRFKPAALDGFFTSWVDVASYIERMDMKVEFKPVGIFPTSETVTDTGRALLERVFDCPVYNQYASSEGAPFVTECRNGALHQELSTGVFENGVDNEILVTSFTTYGTPLIRYAIGDSMTFGETTQCACGISGPIVMAISGRNDDFLYRADGAKINSGNVSNLFKNMPNSLIRAQAIQDERDAVLMLLEVDTLRYTHDDDELLRDEFEHKFGPDTKLLIRHVDAIPRETSGKYRLIKNNVPKSSHE